MRYVVVITVKVRGNDGNDDWFTNDIYFVSADTAGEAIEKGKAPYKEDMERAGRRVRSGSNFVLNFTDKEEIVLTSAFPVPPDADDEKSELISHRVSDTKPEMTTAECALMAIKWCVENLEDSPKSFYTQLKRIVDAAVNEIH